MKAGTLLLRTGCDKSSQKRDIKRAIARPNYSLMRTPVGAAQYRRHAPRKLLLRSQVRYGKPTH